MASLPVFDRTGKEVGKYDIELTDLAPRISQQLLHDVVVMYQAARRQGTHQTKTRSEVAGTTKKMYRQKGTGNARAGSKRSGIRRGGGHIHALLPRDYSYRLPRKAIKLATRMAMASRLQDNELVVIDELSFAAPKTKEMAGILKALGLHGVSTLITTAQRDMNVYKSGRNIDRVAVSPVCDLNALAILTPKKVLVTKAALDALKKSSAGQAAAATDSESKA